MNQFLTATASLILVITLLGLGKKPKEIISNFKKPKNELTSKNSSVTLVTYKKVSQIKENKSNHSLRIDWQLPLSPKDRIELKRYLLKSMLSSPKIRLEAIKTASKWDDKFVIPILKRGLKDSDIKVIQAAALAMERFKNHPTAKVRNQSDSRPPLNVALMR